MSVFQIVTLAIGGATALAALIVLVVKMAIGAFGRSGGMGALMNRYHTDGQVEGQRFERQSVRVGAVCWMRCAAAVVSTRGLWLHMRPPLQKFPAFMIPWSDIRAGEPTRISGLRAVSLEVGSPPLTRLAVCDDLFAAIKPHLR